jgi:uncharacterized membrane protein
MSFQEKRAVVAFITTLLVSAVYFAVMLQRYPEGDVYSADVFRYWGTVILILIPVSIVAKIIVHIGFSIVNTLATQEEEPSITDERDHLIELRAARNSLYVFTIGFALAMGALVIDMPPSTMFIVLILSGILSEVAGDLTQFYLYRRGF